MTPRRASLDAVRADEILPGAALCRKLGIGRHTLAMLRRHGLQPVRIGRVMVYRGSDIVAMVERLAIEQAGGGEQ